MSAVSARLEMPAPTHLAQLDGLRALASFQVFVYHVLSLPRFANVVNTDLMYPMKMLTHGPSAVYLFFVMSGFVLSLSLRKSGFEGAWIRRFYIKRFVRLYPPFLGALVLVLCFVAAFGHLRDFSHLATGWMPASVEGRTFLREALMLRLQYNPPAWSIQVEALAAVIIPFLMLVSLKRPAILLSSILVVLLFSSLAGTVFTYAYMFYLGLLLPRIQEEISQSRRIDCWLKSPLLFCLSMLIYGGAYFVDLGRYNHILCTLGVLGILYYVVYSKSDWVRACLSNRLMRYLGTISYSFYLNHWLAIFIAYVIVVKWVSYPEVLQQPAYYLCLMGVIALAINLFLSSVMWFLTEKPSFALKRLLS